MTSISESSPNITGIVAPIYWVDMNPEGAMYSFTRIREQLDHLADIATAGGPTMVYAPMIMWRSFNDVHPMPTDLAAFEEPTESGYRGQIWLPVVRERYRQLLEAMHDALSDHPHFAGVATQGSATGPTSYDEFSLADYVDALVDIGVMHREVFPRHEVFFRFNYLPMSSSECEGLDRATECGLWPRDESDCRPCAMGVVLKELLPYDLEFGGSHTDPTGTALRDRVYPFYPVLAAAGAGVFTHAHGGSYELDDGQGGFIPMAEIFRFAREELHVDYVFWAHKSGGVAQTYVDAVAVIDANPLPWP